MKSNLRLRPAGTFAFAPRALFAVIAAFVCLSSAVVTARAHVGQEVETAKARREGADALRRLTDRDPLLRQSAAEELARLALPAHRRMVEGYRAQERDERVRLALDWALYRVGKRDTIFPLVRALDSSRARQATTYLTQLDRPDPLYIFLTSVNADTQIKLLQILAHVGDAGTLERIEPLTSSPDPLVMVAAENAIREISQRPAAPAQDASNSPRKMQEESEVEDEP